MPLSDLRIRQARARLVHRGAAACRWADSGGEGTWQYLPGRCTISVFRPGMSPQQRPGLPFTLTP